MTNKEMIKAIIKQHADKGERLYNESCETKEDSQTIGYLDGYRDCANLLLRELNDIQEEPESHKPKITLGEATGKLKELVDNVSEEELVEAHKQLEELTKECMYSKDNYTDEDRKALCDGCEEKCRFNKKEEPANDNFEAEVKKLWMEINTGHSYSIVDSYNIFYGLCMDIADWQKEQQNIIEPTGEEQVKESLISKHEDKTCKENGNFLTQEPVSEDLEKVSKEWLASQLDKSYANYGEGKMMELTHFDGYAMLDAIEFGANWQKANLWKPADGDDLPEIDREVIALLDNSKVVFAHRPPEYWDGKDVVTGKVTRHYPKTYDKGGWNIPNVKYWLDVELSKEIEL